MHISDALPATAEGNNQPAQLGDTHQAWLPLKPNKEGGRGMKLGPIMRTWRINRDLTIETMAAEIGISPSTYSRFERSQSIDSDTFAKILHWLITDQATDKPDPPDETAT